MSHHSTALRRLGKATAAMAIAAAACGLAVSPADAAPQQTASAPSALDDGGLLPGDALTAHNFFVNVAGRPAEWVQQVSGRDHEISFLRGLNPPQDDVDQWLKGNGMFWKPAFITIELRDYQGAVAHRYTCVRPGLKRIDNPPGGNGRSNTWITASCESVNRDR
ncbi:hypothetical protein ACH4PU_05530 [Streptomyces sp. NPDC021100]|uniref:hypothetical protein n=1 Tax=Streptomyces sp. NPDC021100 TaxID=3365114 RepID=UPI00378A1D07